ncbi:MAG TPA: ABC transporter permease [Chloroflexota bacterium]|nr:ABC transporter permease [Chloroflexota bacterium]
MSVLARKLAFYLLSLWFAVTLNFVIPRLMPGDPLDSAVGQVQLDPAQLAETRAALGLTNGSPLHQYLAYLWNLLHGNLGISLSERVPVSAVMGQELPWSLLLLGTALLISFVLGTGLGVLVAWKRGSLLDSVFTPALVFLHSIPGFWLGLLLIYLLVVKIPLFPVGLGRDPSLEPGWNLQFIGSALWHAVLPASALVVTSLGGWVLHMRNTMLSVLGEDYIALAEAKGLSRTRIMVRYAARNAILPQVTHFTLAFAGVVSGQVFVETVFSYPGIGSYFQTAVNRVDYPLLQGLLLFAVLAVLSANVVADLLYLRLDPRLRQRS